jgi:hypothetical protein
MKDLILNITSILVGTIGLSSMLMSIRRQIHAEKEFAGKLKARNQEFSSLLQNGSDTVSNDNHIHIDKVKLNELLTRFKLLAEELPEKKRKEILEPLDQKSSRSQLNYINRLLHISGSNAKFSLNS